MAETLLGVPLDPDAVRELSRAAGMADTWRGRRDRLIREAYASGAGLREIARIVGLTHPAVRKIIDRGVTDDTASE